MKKRMKHLQMIQFMIIVLFFVILFLQFRLVGVQYDDYGYYSLNYGASTPHYGYQYTFKELIRFLKEHYYGANGRLLYFAIWLILFKLGGLHAVQISASLIVTIIWYLLCKIALSTDDKKSNFTIYGTVILCLCYGSMSIQIHQHGTYWFAAFFIYYMPIVATELFILCYEKYYKKLTWTNMMILIPLVFASAWSGETWSVGTVSLMLVLTVEAFWTKKQFILKHILLFGTSVAGLFLLLNSPGIQLRAGDRQWGLSSILTFGERMKDVFSLFFSGVNIFYFLFVLTACFLLAVICYIKRQRLLDLICAFGIVVWEILVYIDCRILHQYYLLVLITILIPVCRYYYFKADRKRNMLLFTAFMSMASLLAVPTVTYRIFIPFEVCSFLLVFDACYELYAYTKKGSYRKIAGVIFWFYCLGMSVISIKNYAGIYDGYKENAFINQYNEQAFLQAKDDLKQGKKVTSVYLKKYPNDSYAATTLYQEPWFKEYIDYYFELPSELEYIYGEHEPEEIHMREIQESQE